MQSEFFFVSCKFIYGIDADAEFSQGAPFMMCMHDEKCDV